MDAREQVNITSDGCQGASGQANLHVVDAMEQVSRCFQTGISHELSRNSILYKT